jgi:hypothetical protein
MYEAGSGLEILLSHGPASRYLRAESDALGVDGELGF